MDEPQVTSEISQVDGGTEKPEISEALQSEFEAAKSFDEVMEVDTPPSSQPGPSSEVKSIDEQPKGIPSFITPAEETGDQGDVSMSELTSEQEMPVTSDLADPSTELDATSQSEMVDLDFTEASVNISQLDVETNNDDSNDAFNALKQSETDALQEPKEEVEEPKEQDEPKDSEDKTDETTLDVPKDTAVTSTTDVQMETDDLANSTQGMDNVDDIEAEASAISSFVDEISQVDDAVEASENQETREEEDETTETTNEGEGVDEDLCLLGDETECDVEKDATGQNEDVVEDDTIDLATTEKETPDEALDIDESSLDKPDEAETTEIEEIHDVNREPLRDNEIREIVGEITEQSCLNCENVTNCLYKLLEESGELKYLCTFNCVKEHRDDNPDKFSFIQNKVRIYEIREPSENQCVKCAETKPCKYRYRTTTWKTITKDPPTSVEGDDTEEHPQPPLTETIQTSEEKFICSDACLKEIIGDNEEKYVVHEVKRRSNRVLTKAKSAEPEEEVPKIVARSDAEVEAARIDREQSFVRRCNQCFDVVDLTSKAIQWETFDFCNERCLGQYQSLIGPACCQCNQVVSLPSIGKLSVRFGSEIKQFCTSQCLNEFKKSYVTCSLCSADLSAGGVEIRSGRRGNKFCNDVCFKAYDGIINPRKKLLAHICSVCNNKRLAQVEIILDGNIHRICSNPCFSAFKFVNNVTPDQCDMCTKHFERKSSDAHTIYQGNGSKMFCTKDCMMIYITKYREIWQCNWCKVSKYSFDMIQSNFGDTRMCSLNCASLYEVSNNALSRKQSTCDHCQAQKQPQYHLTMSDSSNRNFCTYQCVMGFQSMFSKAKMALEQPLVVPAGTAKRIKPPSANCKFPEKRALRKF